MTHDRAGQDRPVIVLFGLAGAAWQVSTRDPIMGVATGEEILTPVGDVM
ncbi:MAG: hypothetical protein WCF36_02095 [Candidatus Nanopelagicales bacterium]